MVPIVKTIMRDPTKILISVKNVVETALITFVYYLWNYNMPSNIEKNLARVGKHIVYVRFI